MRLVNVVGGGDLNIPINLHQFASKYNLPDLDYEPEIYSGVKFKLNEDGPTIMLFRTGTYHITGAKSINDLHATDEQLISFIRDNVGLGSEQPTGPEVRNLVYVQDYGQELDLNELSVGLGMENIEYDPDVHPSLHYNPKKGGHLMIFRTGKLIFTGVADTSEAHQIVNEFLEKLDSMFDL